MGIYMIMLTQSMIIYYMIMWVINYMTMLWNGSAWPSIWLPAWTSNTWPC